MQVRNLVNIAELRGLKLKNSAFITILCKTLEICLLCEYNYISVMILVN